MPPLFFIYSVWAGKVVSSHLCYVTHLIIFARGFEPRECCQPSGLRTDLATNSLTLATHLFNLANKESKESVS
jgi:hypothetical protein